MYEWSKLISHDTTYCKFIIYQSYHIICDTIYTVIFFLSFFSPLFSLKRPIYRANYSCEFALFDLILDAMQCIIFSLPSLSALRLPDVPFTRMTIFQPLLCFLPPSCPSVCHLLILGCVFDSSFLFLFLFHL